MATHAHTESPVGSSPFRLPDSPTAMDLVAKYFRGLGDPTRLRVPALLRVTELLDLGQALLASNAEHVDACQHISPG